MENNIYTINNRIIFIIITALLLLHIGQTTVHAESDKYEHGAKLSTSAKNEKNVTPVAITFSLKKGKCNIKTMMVTYGKEYKELPVPKRKGYAFSGWFTKETGGKRILRGQKIQIKTDTTLYGRWVKKSKVKDGRGLPILMYHWFYDSKTVTNAKKKDPNWMNISEFEKHMKYLNKNDYYIPTWEEVNQFISGKLTLPKNSVVVTVDDGQKNFFQLGYPVLKKYNIHATSFLITSKTSKETITRFTTKYVEFRSHSHNSHIRQSNGKGVFLKKSQRAIRKDLKKSSKKLEQAYVFCYPFGHYNVNLKKALKKEGFKLAVTTQPGRVRPGMNKLELPRVRMSSGTSLKEFKKLVK